MFLWFRFRYFLYFNRLKLLRHDPSRVVIIIILLHLGLFMNYLLLYYLRPLHNFGPLFAQNRQITDLLLIFLLLIYSFDDRYLILRLIKSILYRRLLNLIVSPFLHIICINLDFSLLLGLLFVISLLIILGSLLIIFWLLVQVIIVGIIVRDDNLLLTVLALLLHRVVMNL
jgi:hypothetical protein